MLKDIRLTIRSSFQNTAMRVDFNKILGRTLELSARSATANEKIQLLLFVAICSAGNAFRLPSRSNKSAHSVESRANHSS
jgi:hypothetical protein